MPFVLVEQAESSARGTSRPVHTATSFRSAFRAPCPSAGARPHREAAGLPKKQFKKGSAGIVKCVPPVDE